MLRNIKCTHLWQEGVESQNELRVAMEESFDLLNHSISIDAANTQDVIFEPQMRL